MFVKVVVTVLVVVVGSAWAQVFSGSGCPTVQTKPTFDLNRYLGDWYEIYKFYAAFESGQDCARANYTLMDNGHIRVVNTGSKSSNEVGHMTYASYLPMGDFRVGTFKPEDHWSCKRSPDILTNGKPIQAVGEAFVPDPTNEPAKLKLRFSSLAPWGKYWVLDTDYTNYTLIYSCSSILGVTHYEFAWILSRQKTISDTLKNKLFGELEAYGIKTSNFNYMDQSNCPDA